MTNETPELLKICPMCGGEICRVEITDAGGKRAFSLCCDIPLEILDNWDVYAGLPPEYQQLAIDKIEAEYAEMDRQSRENARRFKENYDKWMQLHPELFHGAAQVVPMHD